MRSWPKILSFALVTGGAAVVLVASPAAASGGTNPQTGCIGGNNMMGHPGMSVWGSHDNPGIDPSANGMVKAMIASDPLWPNMGC